MRTASILLALLCILGRVSADAVSLDDKNFESMVFGGKNAFVKFQAPW